MGVADRLAPYRVLVEIAEQELALAAAGRHVELPTVHEEWARALAQLPPRPPAEAEPLLRRALLLSEQTEAVIRDQRSELLRELDGIDQHRAMGRAYQPAVAVPVPQLNVSA